MHTNQKQLHLAGVATIATAAGALAIGAFAMGAMVIDTPAGDRRRCNQIARDREPHRHGAIVSRIGVGIIGASIATLFVM